MRRGRLDDRGAAPCQRGRGQSTDMTASLVGFPAEVEMPGVSCVAEEAGERGEVGPRGADFAWS